MKLRNALLIIIATGFAVFLFTACSAPGPLPKGARKRPLPRSAVHPAPLAKSAAVISLPEGKVITVKEAPPPLRAEVKPKAPSAKHSWVPGRWTWSKGKWVWKSGHWSARPAGQSSWIPGRWVKGIKGWRYVKGHWK